jgi:DNA-directed RNA polymerase specialized sigma subunit
MAIVTKDELKKLQKTLKTDAAIAEKFGITRQAIHQLRVKYGIESDRNKNKERNEKIVGLYKKGKTGTKIAEDMDLSISQVYRIIKKKK